MIEEEAFRIALLNVKLIPISISLCHICIVFLQVIHRAVLKPLLKYTIKLA